METGLVASGSHTPDSYSQAVLKLQITSHIVSDFPNLNMLELRTVLG